MKRLFALMLTLLGTMTLWSGLMEILAASGDAHRLGKAFRRVLKPLFPGLRDEDAWNAITMNLSANLLGLGNAATPAGIEAAKRLAVLGKTGLNALGMLLVLDKVAALYGHSFTYTDVDMGGCAIDKYGDPLPESELQKCLKSDSVLLGAVGGEKWNL